MNPEILATLRRIAALVGEIKNLRRQDLTEFSPRTLGNHTPPFERICGVCGVKYEYGPCPHCGAGSLTDEEES